MKFRNWLSSTLNRLYGSSVELESETLTELSTRAICPVNNSLIERQLAKAKELEGKGVKVKRLIENQPDTFVKSDEYPIG